MYILFIPDSMSITPKLFLDYGGDCPMKKITFLLCVALSAFVCLSACGTTKPAPVESSQVSSNPTPMVEGPMPVTPQEIEIHNNKIDESSIDLIQFRGADGDAKYATIKTSLGEIKAVLYAKEAPRAVENFIALAEKGYYNNTKFYEVLPNVRAAAGDPQGTGEGGESSFGSRFADEYSLNLWHFNGALAMDNRGLRDTNDSKFYIIQNTMISDELLQEMMAGGFPEKVINRYVKYGGIPNYDFKDTVFGQVVEGMDVVEQIANSPRSEENVPTEDILIESGVIS